MGENEFLEDFAETVKTKMVTALEPLEQITAGTQVAQPALHHCAAAKAALLLRMLPPHSTGELANTVDKHIIRSFAGINNINDELHEKQRNLVAPNLGGRNWKEAALPCQQADELAHTNMVESEGVDACRTKLQKAIALKVMAIRRDRWFVQANERQQQVALSGSTRNQRSAAGAWVKAAPASETPRFWTNLTKGQYA